MAYEIYDEVIFWIVFGANHPHLVAHFALHFGIRKWSSQTHFVCSSRFAQSSSSSMDCLIFCEVSFPGLISFLSRSWDLMRVPLIFSEIGSLWNTVLGGETTTYSLIRLPSMNSITQFTKNYGQRYIIVISSSWLEVAESYSQQKLLMQL